jgi:signal transduction histidine kinase/CheY-like chemotaxis protein
VLTAIFYLIAVVILVKSINFFGVMLWGLDFLNWWPMGQSVRFGLGGVPDSSLSTVMSGLAIELTVPGLGTYLETHWLTRAGLSLVTMILFLTILGTFRRMLVTVDVRQPFDYANVRRVQFIIALILFEIFGLGGVPDSTLSTATSGLAIELTVPGLATYLETHWLTRAGLSLITVILFLTILGTFRRMLITVDVKQPFDFANVRRVKFIIALVIIEIIGLDYLRAESITPVKALVNQMDNALIETHSVYQNADAYAYILLLLLLTLLAIFRRGVALLQQQRDLEKQLYQKRKLEAVGTLASGIGHDFNNILTSIIGYAELAKSEQKQEDIHFALERVLESSYRAKRLTQQIRAIGGQQQDSVQEELVDLKDEVNELLLSIAPTIPNNIKVTKQFEQQKRYEIFADPTKIYQVLLNLCTNALQAMAPEKGQLTIDIYEKSYNEQEGYCLTIKDNGCGMSKQQQEHIFEPYFTTRKQQGGTGLGLSLCYRIVEGYSGHINITSELAQGSCFNIWLPKAGSAVQHALKGTKLTTNNRILLLDDDISVLALVKRKLSGMGYLVSAFSDCNQALNAYSNEPEKFDLVISDLHMPQMTGVQFAEKVQAITANKPLIIITGTPEQVELKRSLAVVSNVISKPIAFSELQTAIFDAFQKHQVK